ncbi:MAG TPA: sigma-70 family RNA polymerase sigma factor [Phycisphaerae bacterium]|nr:sigma-70 family RNA polymerase sigma factor [Phycisphaerae bacterium]HRW55790.1 sigma-70 family RNA polymerase sigma factor [Phycisphaerae bacterium]
MPTHTVETGVCPHTEDRLMVIEVLSRSVTPELAPQRIAEEDRAPITRMLCEATLRDMDGAGAVFPLVYDELHRLAARSFYGQPANHTLQPTALVHEALIRLMRNGRGQWRDRRHFYAVAAMAMRQILVNHAEARHAAKRGGDRQRIAMDPAEIPGAVSDSFLLSLNEALTALAAHDEECARVVELRFFAGLTVPETAKVLGMAPRSVDRCWKFAKGWLHRELTRED